MKLLDLLPGDKRRPMERALLLVVGSALAGAAQVALLNQAVLHPRSKSFQVIAALGFAAVSYTHLAIVRKHFRAEQIGGTHSIARKQRLE